MYKKIILIVGIVIVLCALAIAVFVGISLFVNKSTVANTHSRQQTPLALATVCSDATITKASDALAANDLSVLSNVAGEITGEDHYQNDINCQYIVVRYYLASGQTDKAASGLDQLQRVLSAGGEYSTAFTPPPVNISDLRTALNTEINQKKNTTSQIPSNDLTNMDNHYAQQSK